MIIKVLAREAAQVWAPAISCTLNEQVVARLGKRNSGSFCKLCQPGECAQTKFFDEKILVARDLLVGSHTFCQMEIRKYTCINDEK